ncbi:MAG: helix-turn-helix transcriptional regulator [Candidatus Sumerlaeia bacterium]
MIGDKLPIKYKIFVELITEKRGEAGLLQVELAKRLHKPQPYVSKYETGKRRLDFVEVGDICQAIGIKLIDLAKEYEKRCLIVRKHWKRSESMTLVSKQRQGRIPPGSSQHVNRRRRPKRP